MNTLHQTNSSPQGATNAQMIKHLLSIAYHVKKHQESILTKYDINLQKLYILEILRDEFPSALSQHQIRERLTDKTLDLPRIMIQLDRLCLISRNRNKKNKTISEITITPKGLQILHELDNYGNEMNSAAVCLAETEKETMMDAMQKMARCFTHDGRMETAFNFSLSTNQVYH
ncbi:MAG: hypothetical protein V4615_11700 [Bacteroidota bacterium]